MSAVQDMPDPGTPSPDALPVEQDAPWEAGAPIVDISVLRQALRRQRKLWLGAAAAGLIIGAAFHLVVPAKYTAVTDLYMTEPSSAPGATGIANDISLLETRVVAQRAVRVLDLKVNPTNFETTYSGVAVSGVILTIKLSASSQARAVSYANEVAKAFLAVRAREMALETDQVVNGLNAQIAALNADIQRLTQEISNVSGPQSASQVQGLVNERSADAAQVTQLGQQVQQAQLDQRASVLGSHVLDRALVNPVSLKKVYAVDGLTGLVGGLGLGMGIVVLLGVISDRPRRRSDVAAALGAPVTLGLARYRVPRLLRGPRLRRRLGRPGRQVRLAERRLRSSLEVAPRCALAVVAVGDSWHAALCVASLARSLARSGKKVLLVDVADGRPLVSIFGRRARKKAELGRPAQVDAAGQPVSLQVVPEDPNDPVDPRATDGFDAVLVLATVSPDLGADEIARWAGAAVVIVTAGAVSTARLTSTAQLLWQAGVTVGSAFLVGAAPYDESSGVLDEEAMAAQRLASFVAAQHQQSLALSDHRAP